MAISPEERALIAEYERTLAVDLLDATQMSLWEMLRSSAERFPDDDALRSAAGNLT
jgi:hypothetical protein